LTGSGPFDDDYLMELAVRGTVNCMRESPMVRSRICPYLERVATTYRIPKLSSRREYFRLPYPVSIGAVLVVDGANYKVGEISERGLRIISGVGRIPVDAHFEGTLTLAMGLNCPVKGTVLRIDEDAFIVGLERGPSSYDVIREQRFVSRMFPDWKPTA